MARAELPPLLDKQLAQVRAVDVDGIANNYHPEGMIMAPGATIVGKDKIRAFFRDYLSLGIEVVEVTTVDQSDDTILFQAKVRIGGKLHAETGTWVLRDGLIWRQTAVLTACDEEI